MGASGSKHGSSALVVSPPERVDVASAAKARPRSEVVVRLLRPLTDALVGVLGRIGVDPQAIVLTHTAVGVAAVGLVVLGPQGWPWAALLLQVKTLLDGLDGGVARATGRVTQLGRYLDSVLDTVVNVMLFAALALYGPGIWGWLLAALAALVHTLILSLDFNLERRYTALRQAFPPAGPDTTPAGGPPRLVALFQGAYDALLAPQDRWLARLDDALFSRLAGVAPQRASLDVRLAWSDLFSTATLVNLGLSSQFVALGVCLVLGVPFAYVWFVLACGAYVLVVQAIRAVRFVRYLAVRS